MVIDHGKQSHIPGGPPSPRSRVAKRTAPFGLIPKRQFELPFDDAGSTDWEVYGGFDRGPLEPTDQEMVWVVEA